MGFKFRHSPYVAVEAVGDSSDKVSQIETNFTNYETWAKEISVATDSLKLIDADKLVSGMLPSAKAILLVKTIVAITKILQTVLSKREALDLSSISGIKELEKVGIYSTSNVLDPAKFKDDSWLGNVPKGPIALKKNGWTSSNCITFAKQLQTALANVGPFQKFNSVIKSLEDKLSKTTNLSNEDKKSMSAAVRQATHLFKVRHNVIVRAHKQYTSLKKTI